MNSFKKGQIAEYSITVTPEMFASFNGNIVHKAYSTVSMVLHMEWTARKLILPFLKSDEEGMGTSVKVKHLAPATNGAVLHFIATLTLIEGPFVTAELKVRQGDRVIGTGEVTQVILKKEKIKRLLADSTY